MISRLICWWYDHKRGKRIGDTDTIECPRCKATWTRKPRIATPTGHLDPLIEAEGRN